jgi:hypothetical protein
MYITYILIQLNCTTVRIAFKLYYLRGITTGGKVCRSLGCVARLDVSLAWMCRSLGCVARLDMSLAYKIRYIETEKQVANCLTKPLGPQECTKVIEQLRLKEYTS